MIPLYNQGDGISLTNKWTQAEVGVAKQGFGYKSRHFVPTRIEYVVSAP